MRGACDYLFRMSSMIQIRNVPDDLHRRLKARAALSGMSLSDYLLSEIRQVADRPTIDELKQRFARYPDATVPEAPEDVLRAERGPL